MELTAMPLLRSALVLLCKLLMVDKVCAFVGGWLVYFLYHTKSSDTPISNITPSCDDPGIQVILCGFPRNGCTSLLQAMDILGFPCFHVGNLFKPSTAKLFMKAQSSGAYQDWECLLHGYKSIVNFPAASSYKQLMEMYPNAKVLLNMRDPDKWYDSFSQTIMKARKSLLLQVIQPYVLRCANMFLYQKLLMDQPEIKELSIINYKRHVEEVKQHVPSHKLYVLEMEKNNGWGPLCNFLEVPIPNVPFPFANKREKFSARGDRSWKIYFGIMVLYFTLICYIIIHACKWILVM